MANFVIIVDPDGRRRSSFIDRVRPLLPLVEGLSQSGCSTGDFASAWACEPRAPVTHATWDGESAVLWGEAIPGPGPERLTAAGLQQIWAVMSANPPAIFDGFYAGATYSRARGLVVGADPLGIFPVYYWSAADVVLVASSPEPFRHHPLFRTRFNPAGLVGMLLIGRLLDGQQLLWRDVRRLGAGRALVRRPGEPPREVQQYTVLATQHDVDLPVSGHAHILGQALEQAIVRHLPDTTPVTLSLSGGLDSRMLGGFLRERGVGAVAITTGAPTDIDMQCAIQVARALRYEHRALPDRYDRYPSAAEREATWGHLTNGFSDFTTWTMYPELRRLPARLVGGYFMDNTIGGLGITKAYSPESASLSFDNLFPYVNAWGLCPAALKKLLRREVFGELVEDVMADIRRIYESCSGIESQRAWCFQLSCMRASIGVTAWRQSFGAWPVYPGIDRAVLEAAAWTPAAALAERRAQVELLCRRFPYLAQLPLDRGTSDMTPLKPRLRWLLNQAMKRRLIPRLRRRDVERRYFYRTYNFNGPAWTTIRRRAEPHRQAVRDLFDEQILAELLPRPDVPLQFEDAILDSAGPKSLLGFLLWSKDRLS